MARYDDYVERIEIYLDTQLINIKFRNGKSILIDSGELAEMITDHYPETKTR